MTNALLRQACEVAGLVHVEGYWGEYGEIYDGRIHAWSLHETHPALPAYVASLLGMRIEREGKSSRLYLEYIVESCQQNGNDVVTDFDRIRAALAVLAPEREGE